MPASLIKLIRSLSKSEKRDFQFLTKKHEGYKQYGHLFKLIDIARHNDLGKFKSGFLQAYPAASFEATAAYLVQLITETIIRTQRKRNIIFQLHYGLLQLHVLKERHLDDLWLKDLSRLKSMASFVDYPVIDAILTREELNYLSATSFKGVKEKQLIEKQQKGREALISMRNTFEHYTLYELIKLRLTNQGKTVSEKDQKKLNDLLLEELSIINSRARHSPESRKVHLLFHSFFFTNIGDYQSALKSFQQINQLFEQNTTLWIHTPIEYIAVLDGILDSLRAIKNYTAMELYIQKLEKLDNNALPEHISRIAENTAILYRIITMIGEERYTDAYHFITERKREVHTMYGLISDEKICELFFCFALIYFRNGKIKDAQRSINMVLSIKKSGDTSIIVRVAGLLNLILYYQEKDYEYLEYAIRSYRRMYYGKEKMLQTEKLVLRTIKDNPQNMFSYKRKNHWASISEIIKNIRTDFYEMQLLKYFDFTDWVEKEYI
ncbi:MAG: hypothetical protein QM727_01915 [Niabella sp.]